MNQKQISFFKYFLLSLFILVIVALINVVLSSEIKLSFLLYTLGKLTGLIGFLFLSILIISGDLSRIFDKIFGLDKIIKFQRKFSFFTVIFVLAHPLFFMLSNGIFSDYLIPNFALMPLALGIISLYIFIIIMFCSITYKKISYHLWQYLHVFTYILFFFSLYHAFNWGSDSGNFIVRLIYGLLLTFFLIGIIYRTNYKIKQRKFKFKVLKINWETKDTFTLILKSNNPFHFKAGQFCFLRLNKENLFARHPFTISNSPNGDGELHFTIKLQGRFTKAVSELKEGEQVIVEGPFGTFYVKDNQKELVFIAGGVGITPFMSIITDQINKHNLQKITLFYSSKKKTEVIFKDRLDQIKESWFKKVYILSQEEGFEEEEKGRINKEIIAKHLILLDNCLFYICGPEGLKNRVTKELIHLGVKKSNIIIEDFFW